MLQIGLIRDIIHTITEIIDEIPFLPIAIGERMTKRS